LELKKDLSILVVEDDSSIRESLVEYLKLSHTHVYEADTQEKAYTIYKKHHLDLLIVDINLIQGDGLSLLKQIREHDHTIKAIVISAFSDQEYLLDAMDLKLTKYIIKPISRQKFKQALESVYNEMKMFQTYTKSIILLSETHHWDMEKKELLIENQVVKLGSKEKKLLELFIHNKNKVLSYDEISFELWENDLSDKINSIKTIIKKLRKIIPQESITNIYGTGYKMVIL
jgi:two-component system, OmpR family, response regulator VanR